MYVVLLKFSDNKSAAPDHMEGHKAWLKQGFDDGAFLLAGSLQPGLGGAVLAQAGSRTEIESRVVADPFVAEDVVTAEILEIDPARTDPRLDFLAG